MSLWQRLRQLFRREPPDIPHDWQGRVKRLRETIRNCKHPYAQAAQQAGHLVLPSVRSPHQRRRERPVRSAVIRAPRKGLRMKPGTPECMRMWDVFEGRRFEMKTGITKRDRAPGPVRRFSRDEIAAMNQALAVKGRGNR